MRGDGALEGVAERRAVVPPYVRLDTTIAELAGQDGLPTWSAAIAVVCGGGLVLLVSPVGNAVAGLFGSRIPATQSPVGITVLGATRETCWALAAIAVAAFFRRRTMPPGVSRPSVRWSDAAVLIGLLLIGLYAFSAVWLKAFPGQHTQSESGPDVAASASAVLFVLQALIAIVLAPIFEELMFRGFVFGSLRRWRGVWPAALITGIGFGAIHLPFTSAVLCAPLALFGFGLCLLYARTMILWPCIVAHSLNNAAAFAATQHLHLLEKAGLIVGGVATLVVVMLALGTSRTIQRQRDLWTVPRA